MEQEQRAVLKREAGVIDVWISNRAAQYDNYDIEGRQAQINLKQLWYMNEPTVVRTQMEIMPN